MRINLLAVSLLIVSSTPGFLRADDQPAPDALPETVYIDPAAFLPEAFGRIVEVPIEDVPLTDAAPLIGELAGMPCRVVLHDFAELELSPDVNVTLRAGLPLYTALDRMCWETVYHWNSSRVRIAWAIDRGILNLTTERAEEDLLQLRTYDVADIVAREPVDERAFEDLFIHHTQAQWVEVDGLGIGGNLSLHGGALTVRQSFQTHRKIEALLEALRRDALVVYVDRPPAAAMFEAAFEQTIRGRLDGVAMKSVMRDLSHQTGIEFAFDPLWSQEADFPFEATSDYSVTAQSLWTTLDLLLSGVDAEPLSYYVKHQAIWVATENDLRYRVQTQRNRLETIQYRVQDLVIGNDLQRLVEIIQKHTSGTWVNIDGVGGRIDMIPSGYLMISQSATVHHEIGELLDQLRNVKVAATEPDPYEVIIRCYETNPAMAADLKIALPELVGLGSWRSADDPDASGVGRIFTVRSDEATSILVVVQTRAVHDDIVQLVAQIAPVRSWGCFIPYMHAFGARTSE
jgi:hypothetical protein